MTVSHPDSFSPPPFLGGITIRSGDLQHRPLCMIAPSLLSFFGRPFAPAEHGFPPGFMGIRGKLFELPHICSPNSKIGSILIAAAIALVRPIESKD